MRIASFLRGGLAALALTLPASAAAADTPVNPYAKGPTPTVAMLHTTKGPYAVTKTPISNRVSTGFGAANVWAPVGAPGETFGAVAISPGFLAPAATMAWLGPRLATQGFVVMVFETNSIFDQPASRGKQLLRALDYLTTASPVKALIDPSRLAVVGHSMGGGGALEAAKNLPSLKALVAVTPWNRDKTWPEIKTPALIIASSVDNIAPASEHAIPFYNSLPSTLPKAYAAFGFWHAAPIVPLSEVATSTISWLKRFVDDDTRYSPMLCPLIQGARSGALKDYRSTCEF